MAFAIGEAALLCALAALAGGVLAITVCVLLAAGAGLPAGAVLAHSLITPAGAVALAGGWACATALIAVSVLSASARLADALALVAVAVVALALTRTDGGDDPLAVALAPACCLRRRRDHLPSSGRSARGSPSEAPAAAPSSCAWRSSASRGRRPRQHSRSRS